MLSIVVPVYNEQESIEAFYKELLSQVPKLDKDYEIVFINDGSTDNSLTILRQLSRKDKHLRIYSFRRNQGKAEALTLGFQKAKGNLIVTLDADLQDKPSEVKKLLDKKGKGCDVVCGWRKNRSDPFTKVLSSKIFNFLAGVFWGLHIHDYNCGLKLFTKESVRSLKLYGGLHRFIPLILYQKGFKIEEIEIEHSSRVYGRSKYGFSKLWKDLPDIFTMFFLSKYSARPMHLFGTAGGISILSGVLILAYLTIIHFQGYAIGKRPILFLGMLLVIAGLQLFFTGFLADLITNLFRNSSSGNADSSENEYTSF